MKCNSLLGLIQWRDHHNSKIKQWRNHNEIVEKTYLSLSYVLYCVQVQPPQQVYLFTACCAMIHSTDCSTAALQHFTPPTSAGPLHVGVGANVGLGLDTLEHCLLAQLMPHYVYVLCNGSVHCQDPPLATVFTSVMVTSGHMFVFSCSLNDNNQKLLLHILAVSF